MLYTPDPEHNKEAENEVEITDLDSPSKSGQGTRKFARWSQVPSFRARATDAVSAAVAAQRALFTQEWPDGVTVRVRIGLHTGEPELSAEGYVGLDVHRAARIMSAGHGGQVLLSQSTRDLVEQCLPEGMSLRDLGDYRLSLDVRKK